MRSGDSRDFFLADPDATAALGARLAALLHPGDAALLFGDLGAGKTTLARGLISAWTGVPTDAPSPTYTLAQWYEGPRGTLGHFDLYRVRDPEELDEIGLTEALDAAACVVEWPERMRARPLHRIEARLAPDGEGRRAAVSAFGRLTERLDEL